MLLPSMFDLLGRLRDDRNFYAAPATELRIDLPGPHVRVAVDGVIVALEPPLHYRVRPRALHVVVPDAKP